MTDVAQTGPDVPVRVLTIGHSNRALAAFLEDLQMHRVRQLIDVRSAPYSRFASQFNREALEPELVSVGVQYGYAGKHLGGHPTDPTCYFAGRLPDGKANYLEAVNYAEVSRRSWYVQDIQRLLARARTDVTAIMCSEEDPARCHRHRLIARTLIERGIEVQHVRASGLLEPASVTEDRILTEEGSSQPGLFDALETR